MAQLVWSTVLALHAAGAVVWWWLMPGGFPASSPEFWVNQVAPWIVVVWVATVLLSRGRFADAIGPPFLAAIPLFWMALAISSRLTFPSIGSMWNVPFIGAFVLGVLWVQRFRFRVQPVWLLPLCALPAIWGGWQFPSTQRARDASTQPSNDALFEVPGGSTEHKLIKLTKDAQVHPAEARIVVRNDKRVLTVQPLLTITSRSLDRGWTALAPLDENKPTVRTMTARQHDGAKWRMAYRDEDVSMLEVGARDGAIEIDARSRLAAPVFSHLNEFAEVTFHGHQKLSLTFSPAPTKRIEMPSARAPVRFAYLDENGIFHVMQSAHQEKGPFTELAQGPLKRGQPLVVTVYDADAIAFRITLEDWSRQVSTALSPSAGWGVAVNSVEFMRSDEEESTPAQIMFGLASTGIGRGFQSVGIGAGTYRNRMTVAAVH